MLREFSGLHARDEVGDRTDSERLEARSAMVVADIIDIWIREEYGYANSITQNA